MSSSEQKFEQRARGLYREAGQRIDAATAGRLRAARREALAQAHAPGHHTARWLIPSGAFAILALATLMVWQPPQPSVAPSNHAAAVDAGELDNELPPDADQNDPNLYQDLDFYGWLAASDSRPARR
jgi:hypothetical protein